jgi:EPS-associated MarR family transcriptional regulator
MVHVMNSDFEKEIRYRLLKILSQNSNLSQRDMATKMGVSLGKVNYCLAEFAKKGIIKINRFKDSTNKFKYIYVLTPHGIDTKASITIDFLKRKLSEYDEIRKQINELRLEVDDEDLNNIRGSDETHDIEQKF